MRNCRKQYIFPARAGVPYKINGERVVFDTDEAAVASQSKIEDYYVEQGIWRTKLGQVVVVEITMSTQASSTYPYRYYFLEGQHRYRSPEAISVDGYYFDLGTEENDFDLQDYLSPASDEEIANFLYFSDRVRLDEYELPPVDFPCAFNTGVHISTQEPHLLAYFPTQAHWERRVPQKIKAGRYLMKYFDYLGDDEIRKLSAKITGSDAELRVFTGWEDMLKVYLEMDRSGVVSSCMSKDHWGAWHPLMVYDESDVALVVLYVAGEPKGRALFNVKTKEYPIIYGQWERMHTHLNNSGYIHGSLDGAKINKLDPDYTTSRSEIIEHGVLSELGCSCGCGWDKLIMPYIDGHRELDRSVYNASSVNVYDDYVVINQNGEWEANNNDSAMITKKEMHYCECCQDTFSGEDYWLDHEEISICEDCYRNNTVLVYVRRNYQERLTCEYANEDCIEIDDEWYYNSEVASKFGYYWSDYHDEWVHEMDAELVDDDWILRSKLVYDTELGEWRFLVPEDDHRPLAA